jgi:hypothetical protein
MESPEVVRRFAAGGSWRRVSRAPFWMTQGSQRASLPGSGTGDRTQSRALVGPTTRSDQVRQSPVKAQD